MITSDLTPIEEDFERQGYQVVRLGIPSVARPILRELRHTVFPGPVVLTDVYRLGESQAFLYPILDQTGIELILLASKNRISRGVVSRCRKIIVDPITVSKQVNDPALIQSRLESGEEITSEALVEALPGLADLIFTLDQTTLPCKAKIVDLLMGEALK